MYSKSISVYAALITIVCPGLVNAFVFNYSSPTQCDNFVIDWVGGTPPFSLLVVPLSSVPQNISIPATSYSSPSQRGSYNISQLQIPTQKQFLISMSDATGFGTGGTSAVLTAGSSISNAQCDTTPSAPTFTFLLNNLLQECQTYPITGFASAALPVEIIGLIPAGTSFLLNPPSGSTNYTWTANVAAGTQIAFLMFDSQGHPSNSSSLIPVGSSNDSSCLSSSSPSSASSGTSPTGGPNSPSSHSSNGAIIGGAVAGAIVFLIVLSLFIFLLMRYMGKRSQHLRKQPSLDLLPHAQGAQPNYPLTSTRPGAPPAPGELHEFEAVPYMLPPSEEGSEVTHEGVAGSKAAMMENRRYMNRQDALGEEIEGEGEGEDVVELPPQYTSLGADAQRRPSQRLRGGAPGPSGSGSTRVPPIIDEP